MAEAEMTLDERICQLIDERIRLAGIPLKPAKPAPVKRNGGRAPESGDVRPPGKWGVHFKSELTPKSIPDRVLEHFRTHGKGKVLHVGDLHKVFPRVMRRSVAAAAAELVEKELLVRTGTGWYRLP